MSGTRAGGLKGVQIIRGRYGDDHFKKIGVLGGKASTNGGFYKRRDLASAAGRIGGMKGRRHPINNAWRKQHAQELADAYAHLQAVQEKARVVTSPL